MGICMWMQAISETQRRHRVPGAGSWGSCNENQIQVLFKSSPHSSRVSHRCTPGQRSFVREAFHYARISCQQLSFQTHFVELSFSRFCDRQTHWVAAQLKPSIWRRMIATLVILAQSACPTHKWPPLFECPVCRRLTWDKRKEHKGIDCLKVTSVAEWCGTRLCSQNMGAWSKMISESSKTA